MIAAALAALPLLLASASLPAAPDRAALRASLDALLARPPLAQARVGVAVLSVDTGELVYARDPDALLNPASNVKIFTTAAALLRLGVAWRFETEVWALGAPEGGALQALAVRGKGDPTWTTERLWALAGEIHHRGVRAVKGDLLVDEGWFDGEAEAPGYDQENGDRAYLAPTGALSLNFNTVAIHVGPGPRPGERARVELEPASDYLRLVNKVTTAKGTARRRVTPHTRRAGPVEEVTVEGRVPAGSRDQAFWRKIDDPGLYFGHTLKRFLELRGVKVSGKVRRAPVPAAARLLHLAESEGLADVVRRVNKSSSNFMAEQLLKTLGVEASGAPGSWAKGVAAGEEALAELGLPRGAYVWKNGSGLNDTNRFSARQVATVLREVWRRFPLMAEFASSLPVAGRDGTVRFRMEGTAAEGRLRAKTGTQGGVTSLSGYVECGSGERLVFAVLVNDFPGRGGVVARAVDGLGAALAEDGRPALAREPPPPSDALSDLRQRVATYYGLGLAGDRRNAPFLRTALRTERDPVVRMAAAEAVYLSDPDAGEGRRVFLEAVVTDGPSLARLRDLAGGLDLAAPVVGSLADLAAEGSAEAMSRFLEVGAAAAPELRGAWAEALDEVARSAPEEVAAGLRGAPEPVAEVALAALAARLVAPGEAGHPFLASLRKATADPDEGRALPARELLARTQERVAAVREAQRPAPPPSSAPVSAETPAPTPVPTAAPVPAVTPGPAVLAPAAAPAAAPPPAPEPQPDPQPSGG